MLRFNEFYVLTPTVFLIVFMLLPFDILNAMGHGRALVNLKCDVWLIWLRGQTQVEPRTFGKSEAARLTHHLEAYTKVSFSIMTPCLVMCRHRFDWVVVFSL